jgi:hypothetical protein
MCIGKVTLSARMSVVKLFQIFIYIAPEEYNRKD